MESNNNASNSITDTIKHLISNPKLYVFTVIVALLLVGSGVVNIKTNHISIGKAIESEKLLASKRIALCESFLSAEKKHFSILIPEATQWQMDSIFAKLQTELVIRCYRNHITNDNEYVYSLSRTLLSIIRSDSGSDIVWSTEFDEHIQKQTRALVDMLVSVTI